MKSIITLLVLFLTYCYGEELLGGWSTSTDEPLMTSCLEKGLAHIHDGNLNDEIRSQVSEHRCRVQIVNGLNIRCYFLLRGEKWHCAYYKSFVEAFEPQVEKCEKLEDDEEVVPDEKKDEQDDEELLTANDGEKVEQPLVSSDDAEEEQPASENEIEKEEQSASADKNEKEEQVAQESLMANENEEEDGEGKIDAINKQMSEQNANNEEEEQQ